MWRFSGNAMFNLKHHTLKKPELKGHEHVLTPYRILEGRIFAET